jgi:high-affinity iron transporter
MAGRGFVRALALGGLLLALMAILPVAAGAQSTAWRSADQSVDLISEARSALLLEGRGEAGRLTARAQRAYSGRLARGLRQTAPAADRDARAALGQAQRAAQAGDGPALAAARTRLRSALQRGSYAVTTAAVRAGDVATAREWLLIREFRRATRFTRPGVDATVALDRLDAGRTSRQRALLAVRKDLLDAYQARLSEQLEAGAKASRRGFAASQAQSGEFTRGLWLILRPEYLRQRGGAATTRADRALDAYARAARREDERELGRARAGVTRVLDGFTAAPFTPAEQARRASQFLRFLDLLPIEYDDGTDDGRLTIPFEVQEAVAFRDAAESALSDLEPVLDKRDPRRLAEMERGLAEFKPLLDDAVTNKTIVPQERVEAIHERVRNAAEASFPEEWQESTSESDFDLVDLSLDRMEAAAGAGEWKQAEQARLEAYAFFEFGPELSLRSLAPGIVNRVEGLVWFGGDGQPGLAKLIAERRPRRELRETRLALDKVLEEGAGTLGKGASNGEVVTNAAVIVFREGLEAVLILAAVMAGMRGLARRQKKPMVVGVALALVASAITFVLAQTVLTSMAQYGEKLEAVVGLVAIGVLLLVLNWFFHKVYWTQHISKFHKERKRLLGMGERGWLSAQAIGFIALGFTTVYREGFETVLFLQALELNSGLAVVLEGVALGLVGVFALAFATFVLERKLPYRKMLIVTGVLLTIVLAIMVGKTVRTMQGVGWMPITPIDIDPPFWAGLWLGFFPTVETIVAQIASVFFVIGSYFAAERVKRKQRRRAPGDGDGSNGVQPRTEAPDEEERLEPVGVASGPSAGSTNST